MSQLSSLQLLFHDIISKGQEFPGRTIAMPVAFAPSNLARGWLRYRQGELASQPLDILQPHVRVVHQKRQTDLTDTLRLAVQGLSPFKSRVRTSL